MMKKRVVVSYANLSPELLDLFNSRYPNGYQDHVIKVDKPNGHSFYGVTLETDDASYLVKVDVRIDSTLSDEEGDMLGSINDSDSLNSPLDSLGDEEPAEEMDNF